MLSKAVVQVTIKQAPESYAAIAKSEDYNWPLSSFAPGILKQFDLTDCYRELSAADERAADEALEMVRMTPFRDRQIGQSSISMIHIHGQLFLILINLSLLIHLLNSE